MALCLLTVGCGGDEAAESNSDGDADTTEVANRDQADGQGDELLDESLGIRSSDLGDGSGGASEETDDVPVLPPTVLDEGMEIQNLYEDGSLRRRFTIRTFTDFDNSNLAKGGWEFNGPYVEYYPNGNKICEGEYADDQLVGPWIWWYEDGTKSKECTYQNGAVTGEVRVWRPDGTLERVESYETGKKDGRWVVYHTDGETPILQQEFKDDAPDGVAIEWYVSGQMKQETHFRNGQLDGTRKVWYENGELQRLETYQNGKPNGRFASWNRNGILQDEQEYQDGRRVIADA